MTNMMKMNYYDDDDKNYYDDDAKIFDFIWVMMIVTTTKNHKKCSNDNDHDNTLITRNFRDDHELEMLCNIMYEQ